MFGEVEELMELLIDNRRQWHVRWLAELDADASKSPTERAAEKVWPDCNTGSGHHLSMHPLQGVAQVTNRKL